MSAARNAPGLPRAAEWPLCLAALLLSLPLIALAALLVRLDSPGPSFFRGVRVGRQGRRFRLWKLRTMRVDLAGAGITAAGDRRVTRVGRWLRLTKLDELPSLGNVLAGDLHLVGPRPELPEYVDLADPRWQRVLSVRPGLTHPVTLALCREGELLAQAPDPEQAYREWLLPWKLEGYLAYLALRSPWSDLRVLASTLAALLRGRAGALPLHGHPAGQVLPGREQVGGLQDQEHPRVVEEPARTGGATRQSTDQG